MTTSSDLHDPRREATSPPLVQVYVITFDGKRFLEKCMRTLLRLTDYGNHRVVLVDNGSSDGSGDYVRREFPGVEILRIFPNAGYAHAANRAVEHASRAGAKYVVLLNDDIEILYAEWLGEAVRHAERDPSLGIIAFLETTPGATRAPQPRPTLSQVEFFSGFAMVIPVELFARIGMFDEAYFVVGDEDDLGARARRAGYRTVKLGVPVYHMGGGTNQNYSLRTAYLQMRNGIRYCIKNRSLARALLRAVRSLDVACNPWPVSFDPDDAAHRRMRNSGNVWVNVGIWVRAVCWNLRRLPETFKTRAVERRRADAAMACPPYPAQPTQRVQTAPVS